MKYVMKPDAVAIGENVRNLRIKNYMTQMELAEKMDVSNMTIYRIENGIGTIKMANLLLLAEIFQVEISVLMKKGAVKDPKNI